MQLNREKLSKDLETFALNGNGVVVGLPGVGKTYLLKNLCSSLIESKTKCLYLPVDKLSVEHEFELERELKIKTNLVDYLLNKKSDKVGLIIIDGFDAARSDGVRTFYLNLIKKLKNKLHGSWNILVSVRIYDAQKSGDLLDLFPETSSVNEISNQSDDIICRHFVVPKLFREEIKDVLYEMTTSLDIQEISPDLKKVLSIPFNIWLLEKLINNNFDEHQLSTITSQVQLLDLFWKYWVADGLSGDNKQFILTKITQLMVDTNSLSVRKENVYNPEYDNIWRSLLSSEILKENKIGGQKVSFSHNILFDYAVSVLLIEDNYEDLINFLNSDLSRPLFLRPSLNYYFARLWVSENEIFWENFWSLFSSKDVKLHLFSRLLPIKTIVEETKEIEELDPLFDYSNEELVDKVISRIIQALIALEIHNDKLWVKFLNKSSKKIRIEFARELSIITSIILDRAKEVNDELIIACCGQISRSLLEWIWKERTNNYSSNMDFLARITIPLVAQTYGTNIKNSRKLLKKNIELLNEENFSINLIFVLVNKLNYIWPIDPEFAADVYRSVFRYQEVSDAVTTMGTPVVPLSSNRRQDYEMCYFQLIQHFPKFLKDNPIIATQAGIESLNSYIIEKHVVIYLEDKTKLNEKIEKFKFRGIDSEYVPDGSFIWDERSVRYNEPLKMGDEIVHYLSGLKFEDQNFSPLLDVFAEKARVAFFWKRLLQFGSENLDLFASSLTELCTAVPIQLNLETTYALTNFLKSASEVIEKEDLLKIEESILKIPDLDSKLEKDYLIDRRNRYLSHIPFNLLQINESIKIVEEIKAKGKIPENNPPVKFGKVIREEYSEEKWLKDSGIRIEKPDNQKLCKYFQKFDKFNSEFLNKIPDKSQAISLLSLAKELYHALKVDNNADEKISKSGWTKLTTYCEIISRREICPQNDEFIFCRKVLLEAAKHPEPKPNPEFDSKYNSAFWTPAPRNEAAIGLLDLAKNNADEQILNSIRNLITDKVPSVRYLVVSRFFKLSYNEPELFWDLAEKVAHSDKNIVVQTALINSLKQVVAKDELKTTMVIKILSKNISYEDDSELLRSLSSIMIWLLFVRDNQYAKDFFEVILENLYKYSKLLDHMTFYALQYLDPENYDFKDNKEPKKEIEYLMKIVNVVSLKIDELQNTQSLLPEEKRISKLGDMFNILDEIVIRIYFNADVRGDGKKLSDSERKNFYFVVKPLLEKIISMQANNGVMLSGTAYHFLDLLKGVLKYDPVNTLHMASEVIVAAESTGFNIDHLALGNVVDFVEVLLADHKKEIKNENSLKDLISILDIFANAGWPEAINLIWRLDEIFR